MITKTKDLIIIGAGAAGLTSGIYAARAGLDTLILENALVGGQMSQSSIIENYPAFEKISGLELGEKMRAQAEKCGAELDEFDIITSVTLTDSEKIIRTQECEYHAKAVIICTGAKPKTLDIMDEQRYYGKGIHFCATCDGYAYKGKTVAVVGGGNSALEEAVFLSGIAEKVFLLQRKDSLNGEKMLIDTVNNTANIEILYNTEVLKFEGSDRLESVIVQNNITSEQHKIKLDGVFIYIGRTPSTDMLADSIQLNENGYIITDTDMKTNINGVYAAGDVREKRYRQIVTAVSDGTCAALSAERFIKL